MAVKNFTTFLNVILRGKLSSATLTNFECL